MLFISLEKIKLLTYSLDPANNLELGDLKVMFKMIIQTRIFIQAWYETVLLNEMCYCATEEVHLFQPSSDTRTHTLDLTLQWPRPATIEIFVFHPCRDKSSWPSWP